MEVKDEDNIGIHEDFDHHLWISVVRSVMICDDCVHVVSILWGHHGNWEIPSLQLTSTLCR